LEGARNEVFTRDQLDLIEAAVSHWEEGIDATREDVGQDRNLRTPEELVGALGDLDEQKANCQEILAVISTERGQSNGR
jgi:hypothetical protein